jgi:hypothetical protein
MFPKYLIAGLAFGSNGFSKLLFGSKQLKRHGWVPKVLDFFG